MSMIFEQPPLHRLVEELRGRPGSWGRLICDVNLVTASALYDAAQVAATQQGWADLHVSLQPTKILWGVWARWGTVEAKASAPTLLREVASLPAPVQLSTAAQIEATEHPLGRISATMGMWRRAKVRRLDRDHARLAGYYTLAVRAFGDRAVNELHHWLAPNYDRAGLSASVTKLRKMGLLTEAMTLRKPGGDLTPRAIALLTPAERERFGVIMPKPPTPSGPQPEPRAEPAPLAVVPTAAQLADIAAINADNAALVARTRRERPSSGSCEIATSGMAEYLRPAARAAVAAGWDITMQGNGHLAWRAPDGARVVTPLTGQTRGSAPRNVMAELRRAGAPV